MAEQKTIILKDGGFDKTFYIKKLSAMKFMYLTNQMMGMLAQTDQLNPELIRQYINNRLDNGSVIDGLNAAKVDNSVNKEITDNLFGLIIDVLKSVLTNIDQTQHSLLASLVDCIAYQNGAIITQLSMYESDTMGFVDTIVSDGTTLYRLCYEVLKYNYGGYLGNNPK